MANPFINENTDSGQVTINGVTADALSDIEITLSNIKDVLISLLADKQVLQYDEVTQKWKNATLAVVTALSNLSDCTISGLSENQILKYNGSSWVNAALNLITALTSLSDCTITNPSTNQVLQFNGTNWVNATLSILTTLSSLTDCTITSVSNGQVLKFNGTKWVNSNDADSLVSLSDVSVSSPSNDQILVFTTSSSLNKWTPYTLSGVSFNDDTKTISITGTTKTDIAHTDTVIVPSYTDGVDGHIATFQNYVGQNAYPYVWVLNAFGCSKATYNHFFNKNGVEDWQDQYGFAYANRFNVDYIDAIIVSSLSWKLPVEPVNGSGILLRVYGTNDINEMYSAQSAPLNSSNVTFLATGTLSSSVGRLPVTDINPYRFIILQIVSNSYDHSSFSAGSGPYGFYTTQDFSIHNISVGTDFIVSTSPSNGYPQLTYLATRSGRMTYSMLWLLLYEA
jgi:hypothetical protein